MKRFIFLSLTVFSFISHPVLTAGQVPVFVSGTDGHQSYRIPAIIRLPAGDLLAFCEGRVNSSNDFGNIDIVMKRSTDQGKTWSAMQTVVDYEQLQAGNPAPVVDRTDPAYPGGRIFLFYNTGNASEGQVRKGEGYRQVWYKTSSDNGVTWSEAVDITTQVNQIHKPSVNPQWNFPEDWRAYANTPGHAMQFPAGKYKGRIFVAANHSAGEPQKQGMDYDSHGFYTDDHSRTFHLGASLKVPGSNECMAAKLSGDKLMLNARNQKGDIKARIVAISRDGGQTWDTSWFDRNLPDPVCQGSILTVGKNKGKSVLAFCNAANTQKRDDLTLRISYDEGKIWAKSLLVDKGPEGYKGGFTAYSDIVRLGKHKIGVFYERDGYKEIAFKVMKF